MVDDIDKMNRVKETGKFDKNIAFRIKQSFLFEKLLKNLGEGKKFPSLKIMLKTEYTKIQKEE